MNKAIRYIFFFNSHSFIFLNSTVNLCPCFQFMKKYSLHGQFWKANRKNCGGGINFAWKNLNLHKKLKVGDLD